MAINQQIRFSLLGLLLISNTVYAAESVNSPPPGEGPAMQDHLIEQSDIESGTLGLNKIRKAGGIVFTTPFNLYDGLGDGPPEIFDADKDFPFRGDRASMQTKHSMVLRVNGLDSQTCFECHSVVSRSTVPFTLGIGGHGGVNNMAMFNMDILDPKANEGQFEGVTETSGRVINPPFMFGVGAVELLAKEMTRELQGIKHDAKNSAEGTELYLITKGVFFGTVVSNGDGTVVINRDNVQGIEEDLVVRPFGRKGENFSIRDFDRGAMAFHLGIQAEEIFGSVDADGDGVKEELSIGEMSALSVFLSTLPRPEVDRPRNRAEKKSRKKGKYLFRKIGCTTCHIPELQTESKFLTQSFPDIADDPDANVFMQIDMTKGLHGFKKSLAGGIRVPLFADLKRHDMGAELAESTGSSLDPFFTTAKLWGIADSAPYLHDGRATTLTEAILAHGGEAEIARDGFANLSNAQKINLLLFLRSLKLPKQDKVDSVRRLLQE